MVSSTECTAAKQQSFFEEVASRLSMAIDALNQNQIRLEQVTSRSYGLEEKKGCDTPKQSSPSQLVPVIREKLTALEDLIAEQSKKTIVDIERIA
jgi:hypothetical protein